MYERCNATAQTKMFSERQLIHVSIFKFKMLFKGFLHIPRGEKTGNIKIIAKKYMKKDLMKLVFESFTRSCFLTFERYFRDGSQDAKSCPLIFKIFPLVADIYNLNEFV